MGKYTGLNCKVLIGDPDAAGTFSAIAGQRDATLNMSYGEIDVTSKDSVGGWEEVMAGLRSWDISVSGAHVAKDVTTAKIDEILLRPAHTPESGQVPVQITMEHGDVYSGNALVTSFSKAMPHADLVTYDLSLRGNGPLSKVAGISGAQAGGFSQGIAPAQAQGVIPTANKEKK